VSELRDKACDLNREFALNRREGITDENQLDVQALCVAEEAGELVGAYRRWAGKARRNGSSQEIKDEIADVLIAAAVFAERLGIDIDKAVRDKLDVIRSRGWKEEEAA
jgi:NTP pyrophosphatase (non-canonical NTP hydrolase)